MFLKRPLHFLTGDYTHFSLESRIFHSFCIVAIVTLFYCVFLNFFLNLPFSAWLSLAAMLVQCFLYYLSRFLNKTKLSIVLSIIFIHLVLITNYIYNSGIDGPSLLLLLAVFFIITAVSEPGSYKYWISLNVLIALGLTILEYFYPNIIQNMYTTRLTQFGDMATSYCLTSLTILIGLRYMKKNYYDAQDLLKTKADDLERINQTKNKMFSIKLIAPIMEVFRPIANRKEVSLSSSIEPNLQVYGDKNMLELVIRNILSNAIKFTHPEGSVSLIARSEKAQCLIIIKDTGTGMTDLTKSSIFSVKAESTYGTKNEKGVGLGLNLSKEFVELQNGSLRFESELVAGTIFYISMPLSG